MSDIKYSVQILFDPNSKKKSSTWEHFGVLLQNEIAVDNGFIYCKICVEEKNKLKPKYVI